MIRLRSIALLALCSAPLWGAKVILKDGKTYDGRIVEETGGDVLMRVQPENKPRLLPSGDILTVVRDPAVTEPQDPLRYTALELRLSGNVSDSKNVELGP